MTGAEYVSEADRSLRETYEGPMPFEAYLDRVVETPSLAAHAPRYLLSAIEAEGTRTVIEEGEEKERYCFFDDPHNDGEHAVLGNTEVLNAFVADLRSIVAGRGKAESIIWFSGPTATGKSELKRCIVNGLRAYSKTPEGRRYTIEWNVAEGGDRGLTYGTDIEEDEDDWYESPVQIQPLAVLPPDVRTSFVSELNEQVDDGLPIRVETELDPFSREAYEHLEERYRRERVADIFSAITSEKHLRVKNYVVDVGSGIGVLHAEDEGRPKERLVGSWMPEMLQVLDSRGRKNPQAFSYDGVLAQGNAGVTIVEDASQHADLLQKLLNVPEEGTVKLDKGIGMDIDTQLIVFSNPDLESQLNKQAERGGEDPLKALKRRLDKRAFGYLTNLSLETALIRRELTDETAVWTEMNYGELDDRVVATLETTVRRGASEKVAREFAPHAIEAAALYDVVSRLDADDLPRGLDLAEKALLFDRGYVTDDGERYETDDFDFDEDAHDGEHGIPVTYTRDVLADLLQGTFDRSHPDLPVENVITPDDVLDAMVDGLDGAPVFGESEREEFEARVAVAKSHVHEREEADVLEAMLAQQRADEDSVTEYVEHVYAWATDEPVETDRGEIEPDPLTMKVFEIESVGRFDEEDYEGTEPSEAVRTFRREEIVTALNRRAWEQRGEDFRLEEVDLTAIPVLEEVLGADDWDDVRRAFEDFDPYQWEDPPEGTQTEALKEETIDRLLQGPYSPASAELATRRVMAEVADRWD